MASERRQQILLGVLLVVLAGALAYEMWPSTPAGVPSSASNQSGRAARDDRSQPTAPDVHIGALSSDRPKPDEADRDLFKFKPKAPPPAPSRAAGPPPQGVQQAPPARSGPPPLPPIPLKFIGYIEAPGGKKIASLSDGKGVWTATEGQTVLGQYKIWRIGVESIDISYLDGRGRQTIRMTGQ
jgi:hypothetical protein